MDMYQHTDVFLFILQLMQTRSTHVHLNVTLTSEEEGNSFVCCICLTNMKTLQIILSECLCVITVCGLL